MKRKFPLIMGIVNVTPDSFSDGGKYYDRKAAIDWAIKLIEQGADIVDIGGESTRPNSDPVSVEEELDRVIPVIKGIKEQVPEAVISVDTMKYEVASEAVRYGATIINDVSGLRNDIRIATLSATTDCTLIIMHMQGTPKTMQINPTYGNVVEDIFEFLKTQINVAKSFGVKKIVADVGIGFGKTVDHNWELLRNLSKFTELGVPLMLGISRKSFLGKTLNIEDPIERDIPTIILHSLLLNNDIEIVRVHNVKNMIFLKEIYKKLYYENSSKAN
ncbi:MAG: dihydropteroate synthase [Ignavibacteria bacterium]|nr:dihydropteroate synthase [Ignavibacteria bacterium]